MIGLNTYDAALAGIEASMQAAMPHRVVQRSLVIDPMNHDPAAPAFSVTIPSDACRSVSPPCRRNRMFLIFSSR